jgi:hypothetical protein
MTCFVFLGPSLPLAKAREIVDAIYLPPVAMGDLYTLVASRARPGDHVAIVDGVFEQVPAVWHKEILHALSRGINVHGAASMGALRASELDAFGMRGVGRIYRGFASGALTDDDEVVVAHARAESGFRSLSTALVSIRFALADLADAGKLPGALAEALVDATARLPYPQRSWGAVLEAAAALGASEAERATIRAEANRPDAKARDAAELLHRLASAEAEPFRPDFVFQTTSFWTAMTRSMAARVEAARLGEAEEADRGATAAFARAAGPDRDRMLDQALLDRLVLEVDRGAPLAPAELRDAALRIARRQQLPNGEALIRWRERQGLIGADWQRVVEAEARRHRLRGALAGQLDGLLIARLKADGRYEAVLEARGRAREAIEAAAIAKPSLADFGLDADQLERWYAVRFGPMSPDPESHARALGFESLRDFVDALLEAYLAEEGIAGLPQEREAAGGRR